MIDAQTGIASRLAACSASRLNQWCEVLDEAAANRIIHVHRGTRVQKERADRLLLHLFQHQIHHRGQAHEMLSGTSAPPPQLDEFFSVAEAPLRGVEFNELGSTEATVWRERDCSITCRRSPHGT